MFGEGEPPAAGGDKISAGAWTAALAYFDFASNSTGPFGPSDPFGPLAAAVD